MITPWYKEPWAWLVFFLPFSAVVAGISTYIIANNDPDPLVVGEYYKAGKAINLQLKKVKLAQKLGIKFDLQYDKDQLVIRPTGIEKTFPLLNVRFSHPTLEKEDFSLKLTPDGNGHFRHDNSSADAAAKSGKWHITISPFEDNWKIQNTITLPQSQFIEIAPDLTQAN